MIGFPVSLGGSSANAVERVFALRLTYSHYILIGSYKTEKAHSARQGLASKPVSVGCRYRTQVKGGSRASGQRQAGNTLFLAVPRRGVLKRGSGNLRAPWFAPPSQRIADSPVSFSSENEVPIPEFNRTVRHASTDRRTPRGTRAHNGGQTSVCISRIPT
jgi:hypothetical protein